MPKTILAVGAHMDDVEIAVGGILCQAVDAGHRFVAVVGASDYSTWKLTHGHEEQVKHEQLELADRYGYEKRFLDYPYHHFPSDIEAKKKLAEIYVELQPDITFVHHVDDHWPDHVNAGIAAKDAVLFSHGYTDDTTIQRCPRVFAFNASPAQTYNFEPDLFVPVDGVMERFMNLIVDIECCLPSESREQAIEFEMKIKKTGSNLPLTPYGLLKLSQCAEWGDINGSRGFAIALKTLWGPKDGRPLW